MNRSIALLMALVSGPAIYAGPAASAPDSKSLTGEVIRQYILEHPEVIIESVQAFQARQKTAAREKQLAAVTENHAVLAGDALSPSFGADAKAPGTVTIVEFFDYRCGYCKKVSPVVAKLLETDKHVRVVFKELPILGPESELATLAALAAARQNAYAPMHRALIESSSPITMESIAEMAKAAGLNLDKLLADMQSEEVKTAIDSNRNLAEVLGVQATPAFVIGDRLLPGALDESALKALVEQAKAAAK